MLMLHIPGYFKKLFLLFTLSVSFCIDAPAQYPADSLRLWTKKLAVKDASGNRELEYVLDKYQSGSFTKNDPVFNALESGDLSNPYYQVRYLLAKASLAYKIAYPAIDDSVKTYCAEALKKAYELADDTLTAFVSWHFGDLMHKYQNKELAVMYCMNSAEISEENGIPFEGTRYRTLGDVLFTIREYEKAIYYCRLASMKLRNDHLMVTCLNTIALGYQRLGNYDSAMMYYDSVQLFLKNFGDNENAKEEWKGIITGNMAQIYFAKGDYKKALQLFEFSYEQSNRFHINYDAGNALQWLAKTNLVLGNTGIAKKQIQEAFRLVDMRDFRNYGLNLYNTAAEVYRAVGLNDSAYYFSRKYLALHDSIEAEVVGSRLEISRIRLENEKYYYDIQRVMQQKKMETNRRDMVIAAILIMAVVSILYLNRKRAISEYRQQLIAEKSRHAEQEVAATREQFAAFTNSLVEKTQLIDQLQKQLDQNDFTATQHEALSQLMQSRIVTEEEWTIFKGLFEKIYPGFFLRLKENYPGITVAEQRMASMLKIRLTNKEIAAMLGISVESAQRTRLRLKQRLNLSNEIKVEEYVASL